MNRQPSSLEVTLRALAPQVLGSLMRSSTDFATTEDAVQEALLAAARQWPTSGWPDNPKAWLVTVASRRRIELWRNEAARRNREQRSTIPATAEISSTDGTGDDSLLLLVLCCHSAVSTTSQVALTLRAVGGLTTAEIGRALLVPEATVAQRISRAKASIRAAGARFELRQPDDLAPRLAAVRHVLYLIFNEGYLTAAGTQAYRPDLCNEAIHLTRQLHQAQPDDGESAGLLALMLLTDARRPARLDPNGALVPLADQNRQLWHRALIDEGTVLLEQTLRHALIGPYQLQAAIAALHDEADCYEHTDWPQILALYNHLVTLAPGPVAVLNRIVAVAMVRGATAALAELDAAVTVSIALQGHSRVLAVRAHLLELAGDVDAARRQYQQAATASLNLAEQRHLLRRAANLGT